ncbi:MAG: hypothetical protein JW774_10895 [Candidatus Aureabacteria bacterium]|nr:hypothetical protein [Candidatus Auribacterota bacterium]
MNRKRIFSSKAVRKKAGVSLLLAVLLIVILGIILGSLATLGRSAILSKQAMIVTDDVFFVAESGIETGISWLTNLDTDKNWYNNADTNGVPQPRFQFNLEPDELAEVSVKYPATLLKTDVTYPGTVSYLEVYFVDCFMEDGQISPGENFYVLIGSDLIKISNYDSALNRLFIDPVLPVVFSHYSGETVFPLAVLSSGLSTSDITIPVQNTRGFLKAGTIKLFHAVSGVFEYIRYTGKTASSFTGCVRGSNNTTPLAPTAAEAASGVWRIISVEYEGTLVAKGTRKNLGKTLEVTVQYKKW